MRKTKKIIVIIQRSNGDVFLSSSLVKALYEHYEAPQIDLLVNDDTISIAKLIPFIKNIYTFSYQKKQDNRWKQEKDILTSLFRKYDLSINLTASDRSVFYALISAKKSISALEDIKPIVDAIEEKNDLLFFNLQRQQEPAQLLQWLELPEFSHLKFPLKKDVIVIKEPRENIASED